MQGSRGPPSTLRVSKGPDVSPWQKGCPVPGIRRLCVRSKHSRSTLQLNRYTSLVTRSATPEGVGLKVRDDVASTISSWEAFAASASGEWEGVTATFDPR